MSGNNTYSGNTTINANATLQVGVANTVPSTSDVTDNGTFDLNGNNDAIGALSGSSSGLVTSTAAGTPLLTVGATDHSGVFSGVIENGSADSVALTKIGSGTLTLSGNNTYTGGSTLDGGTTVINTNASLGDQTGNATINIAVLEVNGNITESSRNFALGDANSTIKVDNSGSTYEIDGTIGNNSILTGTLNKTGTGTLDLTGNNTYTGNTVISAGTLLVNNAPGTSATGNGTVTVGGTATLGGNGTVTGDIIVQSGGTVSPGSSAGTLTTGGSATFDSGATYSVELNGNVTGTFDQLVTTGNVSLGGNLAVTLGYNSVLGDSFEIINNSGNGTVTSGIFDGLSEGSILSLTPTQFGSDGLSRAFQITYVGGSTTGNNDVFLTQVQGTAQTYLEPNQNPQTEGVPVTFTATITSTFTLPMTGTVTFEDGANTLGTASLTGSSGYATATFTTSTDSTAGNFLSQAAVHSITAIYSSDANFFDSYSNTVLQTITQHVTSTVISSSTSNTSVFGESVNFTATVAGATDPNLWTPTGNVTFLDNGLAIPGSERNLDDAGTATYTTSALTVTPGSPHTITVTYSGDNLSDSTLVNPPGSVLQTVNQDSTTTTVSADAGNSNPSVYGQLVTFTAVVTADSPGYGTPTGTVTFEDGSISIGTAGFSSTTPTSGTATFTTVNLNVPGNTHTITAVYSGDTNFSGLVSSTNSVEQVVNAVSTTTTLTSSTSDVSVFGQPVTFTATVTSDTLGTLTPQGTATFILDNGATEPTPTLDNGKATFTTTFTDSLSVTSSHTLTVTYSGDDYNFITSGPTTLIQTVNPASTTTTVTSSTGGGTSVYGQSVTFTATVSPQYTGTFDNGGTVTFSDGSTSLGTASLSGSSLVTATFTTSTLAVSSSHSIKASYSGDTNFTASSNSMVQTVSQASTSTTVTSSTNVSVFGQSVTFTATVSNTSTSSSAIPAGTVTFKDGGQSIGTGTLSLGSPDVATFTAPSSVYNKVATHTITAVYSDSDNNFATSTAPSINQTVNQATTTTTVSSLGTPSTAGHSVTFTATVNIVSPGAGPDRDGHVQRRQ